MKSWQIIQWEDRPAEIKELEFTCPKCGEEALMLYDAINRPLGQVYQGGIVWDETPTAAIMPGVVKCPHCRVTLSNLR